MGDSKILYDSFNFYYERGMTALKNGEYDIAKDNILIATESLLKLAKESNDSLKQKRLKRADELTELVSKIEEKMNEKVNVKPANNEVAIKPEHIPLNVREENYENVTLESAMKELESLEGLSLVKQQVSDRIYEIQNSLRRKEQGLPVMPMSYHMVFVGNPGTGKTTVARIIGKIYHALGILSKGHLVETDRRGLIGAYQGHTEKIVQERLKEAEGGILFIDEAYTLKTSDGDDFGQIAIDILNKEMEDSRNNLVVIVAGYPEPMEKFLLSNSGLKSRFKTTINFEDYSGDELYNIFLSFLKDYKYVLTENANEEVYNYLHNKELNKFTGNARDVRNLLENINTLQCRRLAKMQNPSKDDVSTITIEDLPFKTMITNVSNLNKSEKENKSKNPEDELLTDLGKSQANFEFKFDWDSLPNVKFDDIAGLDYVKEVVTTKVLLPLKNPKIFDGYVKKNGGGLFLYGPPGTGKTMIAAAIANEIGAKFCSVKPSDLLNQGGGNTEKAVRSLFSQARQFPCAVIYFDEMDSIAQKNTKSSYSRQLRSELLAQIQGIDSYNSNNGNILFLIASTNKPWEVDSAFVRPGRFGTKVYVGLPDEKARTYMIENRFKKILEKGIVNISDDINVLDIVERTNGFNGSDITNLLDRVEEISAIRGLKTGEKVINLNDFDKAFDNVKSSVQLDDIEKLTAWKNSNDC